MNVRQLEIYRAVMITGTASGAAELLGITQPAVSRTIVDLETSVGFKLFDRVKGRLVTTPEGHLFFEDVTESFIGLDSLRASAARIRDFGSGVLRIASMSATGQSIIPEAIALFQQDHPRIAITLQVLPSSTVRDLVANHHFDIGVAADEVDLIGVDHRVFASYRAYCAMHIEHRLAGKDFVTPQDLDGEKFIALAPEDRARHRMHSVFDEAGVKPQIIVETPSSSTVCRLAALGIGVGLINPLAAVNWNDKNLVLKPFRPDIHFKSVLLFRPDTQRSLLVKDFTSILISVLHRSHKK